MLFPMGPSSNLCAVLTVLKGDQCCLGRFCFSQVSGEKMSYLTSLFQGQVVLTLKGLVNEDMNLDLNSLDLNPPNNLISSSIVHKKSIYSLILELCSFFFYIPPMTTRG